MKDCHSCSNHRSLLSDIPIPIQTGPGIFEPFTENTPVPRSLASEKYNEKTIELLDSDPQCQIVIATKALSLGIHAEELLDSIVVGTADTK